VINNNFFYEICFIIIQAESEVRQFNKAGCKSRGRSVSLRKYSIKGRFFAGEVDPDSKD
jgi:hypothetical protein